MGDFLGHKRHRRHRKIVGEVGVVGGGRGGMGLVGRSGRGKRLQVAGCRLQVEESLIDAEFRNGTPQSPDQSPVTPPAGLSRRSESL